MPTFQNPASQNNSDFGNEKNKVPDAIPNSVDQPMVKGALDGLNGFHKEGSKGKDEKENNEVEIISPEMKESILLRSVEDGEKSGLPSIKATQKDRSKNASVIEKQHKMMLLVEILRLLEIYKAHSIENKFQQWAMVQDALEKQDLGSKYRRMDKAYCFRKKVLNAINSWIDWARVRGYPDPNSLRKHPSNTWKFPSFLELLYKIYNETKDAEKLNLSKMKGHFSEEHKEEEKNEEASEKSIPEQDELSINSSTHLQNKKVTPSCSDNVEDDNDDDMQVASVIQAVSRQAALSGAPLESFNSNPSMRNYLSNSSLVQQVKAEILSLKRSSLQAELDDMDLERLERIEAKISGLTPGSLLYKQYSQQRKRCISRLERTG